ncbi:Glycosyl hydrolases family 38 C-terminal domain-containing protein [Kaistia soli DSM 19436]|uniref:Glycosyl hydrolases family 38 C-terminal domain-containing protein n=1 Tax=Kaistia soli DSM 19436 TaxID=1122133 RepID=A0A1M5IIZ9_9HYPH|nr:hypothetical protein [Kaistia soli]SHG27890.1 Glycosyl hydrolases family 38 C-terminal domain-containing protein [Kaistia soli DSM 19436]
MIREILFVHHSHTDIGYTHPQPVVMELHRRFIDEALDIADDTADFDDESRFRWTCEVTGVTMDWWNRASNGDRDRFLAAVRRGQFEVAGMQWHMTPLMDHSMALDVLKPIQFFRDLGIPVRSAMNTDVNGLPWGMVDALLDHGISGISMAINEHFGHALRPWPRAFRWQSPAGREIIAYNGFIYGVTSDRGMRVPVDFDEALVRVPQWAKSWEERGYPHPFLMMQITNIRYHDNGAPQRALPEFIRRFNATDPAVRLRFVTISEFFDRLRDEPLDTLPLMRGDWTDWWNFGAGSTAQETRQALQGQRDLAAAEGLRAFVPGATLKREDELFEAARRALGLYAEHTWGADRSINQPFSPETRTQQLLKLALAPEGASIARMLRRDGLERLAGEIGGEEPRLLVYNPHPFAVRQSVKLPLLPPVGGVSEVRDGFGIEAIVPHGPSSHRVQRQDVIFSDLPDRHAIWTEPFELPALGYLSVSAASVRAAASPTADSMVLSNGRLRAEIDPAGGLTSLTLDGIDYVGKAEGVTFGVPVLERPEGGTREAIFDRVDVEAAEWNKSWHTDWSAVREAGKVSEDAEAITGQGRAEIRQSFTFSTGDRVTVVWRLVADQAALECEAIVDKAPLASPHGIYLPLPVRLAGAWHCDYETAGANVRLDDEQLPFASRHYITTQRYIRIADGNADLTVATPDAPLWQVGGFTFGRWREPDGSVVRPAPILNAWLTNNYWSTNFQADQGGRFSFRFTLLPGSGRPLGAAVQAALAYTQPLAAHVYAERGPLAAERGQLLDIDAGPLMLTRLEPADGGVALTFLNPDDQATEARIRAGRMAPAAAKRTSLSGAVIEDVAVANGELRFTVGPRAWTRVVVTS